MEGRTESWLDAASAFQPFYTNSHELLENNYKGANRLALLNKQMNDLTEAPTDMLKEILQQKDSKYSDLKLTDVENGTSGKNSPVFENKECDRSSVTSSCLEESDQDEDVAKLDDDKEKLGEFSENNEVELKKARVENIITNIHHSPRSNSDLQNGFGSNESRRKKRKQNQPQQHDSAVSDPKYFKTEQRSVVQQQLHEMQQQLASIQKRYSKLFDDSHSDDEFDASPLVIDVDDSHAKQTAPLSQPKPDAKINMDSLALNGCKLTRVELQDLNKSLKSEIAVAVGSAIDSVVKKFMANAPIKKEPEKPVKEQPVVLKSPTPPPTPAEQPKRVSSSFDRFEDMRNRVRSKVSDKHLNNYFEHMAAARAYPLEVPLPFPRFFSPPSLFYPHTQVPLPQPLPPLPKAPEQTEALSLVCPPKKKRTKVTDTRLSPRAARALLQEPVPSRTSDSSIHNSTDMFSHHGIQTTLPTSVAIPNPSLQHSDVLAMYSRGDFSMMNDATMSSMHPSPSMGERGSPGEARTPSDTMSLSSYMKKEEDNSSNDESCFTGNLGTTSTLTPMHLRKAKLMFFFVRYPSSAVLKMYFPDILFNKNNTAQLVKWFSNFREFFYIQMEKYSRAALSEGVQQAEELVVTTDSEIYRVLNLHYNRNNQLEIPDTFRLVVQLTLREFFKSISTGKDSEQSWKKQIYKIIARQDESVPEYFKSVNWMEQLAD